MPRSAFSRCREHMALASWVLAVAVATPVVQADEQVSALSAPVPFAAAANDVLAIASRGDTRIVRRASMPVSAASPSSPTARAMPRTAQAGPGDRTRLRAW